MEFLVADAFLRAKDFEQMTVEEQALAKRAIERLRLNRIETRTRRFRPSLRGERIDLRRTLKGSLRAGGNRFTAYNWENNASNAGRDYMFQNDAYLVMSSSTGDEPGDALRPLLETAFFIGLLFLREHREPEPGSFDLPGFVLGGLGLSATMFALSEGPGHGWTSPLIVASGIAGLAGLAAFVVRELRTSVRRTASA